MKVKRIIRHYRRFDGIIACGVTSSHIDATGVEAGVTCFKCLSILSSRKRKE